MAINLAVVEAGGGLAIVWGVTGVAFWIVLIALLVLVVRGMRTTAGASAGAAVRVLDERYARGEITREEFLERRTALGGSSPGAPGDDTL
jgi:putative membrane protein